MIDNNLRQETIDDDEFDLNDTPKLSPSGVNFSKMCTFQEKSKIQMGGNSPIRRSKGKTIHKNNQNDTSVEIDTPPSATPWPKCPNPGWVQGKICGIYSKISNNGKLIVLFAWLMIQTNNIIDATKVIEEYGFKYKTDKIWLANVNKLFGMIFLMEESRNDAIKYLDKALNLFKEVNSLHGQAATYYLKSLAVSLTDEEEDYNNVNTDVEAKQYAEKATNMYKLLKHREGFLVWSKLCNSKEKPPNKTTRISWLNDPDYIPFMEQFSDYHFVSLGIEPILTTKFEEGLDPEMVTQVVRRKSSLTSQNNAVGLRRVLALQTDKFSIDEREEFEIETMTQIDKSMPKQTMTLKSQKEIELIKKRSSKLTSLQIDIGDNWGIY